MRRSSWCPWLSERTRMCRDRCGVPPPGRPQQRSVSECESATQMSDSSEVSLSGGGHNSKFAHVNPNSTVYSNSTADTQTQPRILNFGRVYSTKFRFHGEQWVLRSAVILLRASHHFFHSAVNFFVDFISPSSILPLTYAPTSTFRLTHWVFIIRRPHFTQYSVSAATVV